MCAKAHRLEFIMKILALDVGGTEIKSALLSDKKIEAASQIPSDGKLGGSYILQNIMKVIDSYEDYDVIGISTTGQVDSEKGIIIYANDNVPNYTGTNLKKLIQDKYQRPVFVENDVNAAAIGEGYLGAGKEEKDFLCLTYGTGIGGAIVINKEVYKGSSGVAGEMGHIITHTDGKLCACGQKGCYEQYASTTALIREAKNLDKNITNGRILFSRTLNKEDSVKIILDKWIDEIIYGLVNLIHIFNPSCVIMGGGIMVQPYIIEAINKKISDRLMSSFRNVKIISAQLGNQAGLYGMAAIAMKKYDSN